MTKLMKLSGLLLLAAVVAGAQGLRESATTRELTGMLRQFLVDAGSGNRAGFDKFFADDLIYTRAVGVVITKADILKSLENPKSAEENKTTYSAEDITVHDYRDTAVVAFQLVARTEHKDGKVETDHYRNTGTFLRRGSRWQVVAWQATRIQEAEKKQ
jgi:ketosteroid isomerase-like protein